MPTFQVLGMLFGISKTEANDTFHEWIPIIRDILVRIGAEMPNIILEFLRPYSPDFNLIELVWHSAKEYIAHRLFESV
ncbi:hypothetical protein NSMS1_45820 [Nostoc sp. MS1]|nr:hypothetical protein NSMS1_45820 [Nostoc sp. MS1]